MFGWLDWWVGYLVSWLVDLVPNPYSILRRNQAMGMFGIFIGLLARVGADEINDQREASQGHAVWGLFVKSVILGQV